MLGVKGCERSIIGGKRQDKKQIGAREKGNRLVCRGGGVVNDWLFADYI